MMGIAILAERARWWVKTRSNNGEVIAAQTRPTRSKTAPIRPAVSEEYPYGSCRGH